MNANSPRTYLVTGATGGLGTEVTRLMLNAGHHVIAVGSRRSSVDTLAALVGHPERLRLEVGDVSSEAGTQALFAALEGVPFDGVAHLVGGYTGGPSILETPVADLQRMIGLNLLPSFLVIRAAARRWVAEERRGSLVLVGSMAGRSGERGHAAYAASKAAQASLVQSAAEDLAPRRIRVNAVLPGMIATPANAEAMPDADHSTWVTPAQVAGAILYLLSEHASGVTGALTEVAGWGYTAD